MILSWMIYGAGVGLLLAAAGWLLEHPARQRGWPVRWIWIAALLTLLAFPALAALAPPPAEPDPTSIATPDSPSAAAVETDGLSAPTGWAETLSIATSPARSRDLDRWVLAGWGLGSAALVLSFALSYGVLLRRRRGWREQDVDGRTVWVAPDTGPAVVGAFPGRIVVPEWLLMAPAEDRGLMLAHEEEHIRAGDARVLLGAFLVWIAIPWNPALWWIWRALRRAVEMDCDRRVLARGVDPRAYSRLLLDVTERGTAQRFAVAALAESQSFLERRIRLMIAKTNPTWGPRAAGAIALACACVVAACRMDQPEQAAVPATGTAISPTDETTAAAPVDLVTPVLDPGPPTEANHERAVKVTMRSILETYHPEVPSGELSGERVNLYVLIDGNGDVVKSAVDTERRSGACMGIMATGLGIEMDREKHDYGGCGSLKAGEAGPSPVAFFWDSQKPATEQERVAPTGNYLIARILRRGRPSTEMMTAAVQQHYPEIYRDGLPEGETLWFVGDAENKVLHSGRGWGYLSSSTAREDLQRKLPGVRLGSILMGGAKSATGEGISVVWAREEGPDGPPRETRPDPYAHARMYAVTTEEPGREVTIRLEGEAAANLSNFRISGKFTNTDGLLTAITPFSFMVMTAEPFSASLVLQGEGVMKLETESETGRLQTESPAVMLDRARADEAIRVRSGGNMSAMARPAATGLPELDPVR